MASEAFLRARAAEAAEKHRRETETKKYRVISPHAICGVKRGGVVELTADHASRLVGHVEEITVQRDQSADETGHDGPESKE